MSPVTIEIPPDLVPYLEDLASAQEKSLQQVAVERLRSLLAPAGSPAAILRVMNLLPPADASAVDEMEAAILNARLPPRSGGEFD